MSVIQDISGLGSSIVKYKDELESINPVIPLGVMVYEIDTRRTKVGDGITPYKKLSYSSGDIEFAGRGKRLYGTKVPTYIS